MKIMRNCVCKFGALLTSILTLVISTASGQFIEPVKIDFYEQIGVKLEWPGEVMDEQPVYGTISDMDKFSALDPKIGDLLVEEVTLSVVFGDKWKIYLIVDTLQFELSYRPGFWEMYHGYEIINRDVSAAFTEICDISELIQTADELEMLDIISEPGIFTDTKMLMFGNAWPGIEENFKYTYMQGIETGDDVIFMNSGEHKWKYRFPENNLEIKAHYTPGYFIF
jgi:hypothetical protein